MSDKPTHQKFGVSESSGEIQNHVLIIRHEMSHSFNQEESNTFISRVLESIGDIEMQVVMRRLNNESEGN